jgi:AcrR family transcriptional regulator
MEFLEMTTSEVSPSTREQRLSHASRRRREAQKQELRQSILEAASNLFLERGYEGFSLRQVAEQIGYTPTTIYLYFADKDALLFALLDDAFDRFGAALHRAYESSLEPLARLEAIGRAYVRFGLENPQYYEMMFVVRSDFLLQARAAETEPRIASFRTLQEAVTDAMAEGALRQGDVEATSFLLWALMHGIVGLAISMPQMLTPDRIARAERDAIDLIRRGLT